MKNCHVKLYSTTHNLQCFINVFKIGCKLSSIPVRRHLYPWIYRCRFPQHGMGSGSFSLFPVFQCCVYLQTNKLCPHSSYWPAVVCSLSVVPTVQVLEDGNNIEKWLTVRTHFRRCLLDSSDIVFGLCLRSSFLPVMPMNRLLTSEQRHVHFRSTAVLPSYNTDMSPASTHRTLC